MTVKLLSWRVAFILQDMKQELRQLRAEVKSLKSRKDPSGGDLTIIQNLNKQLQTKLGELEHENVNLRMALQVNKLQQVKQSVVYFQR